MAQKVVEYVLLRDEVAKRLTEEVNARLRAGWSLYGSPMCWGVVGQYGPRRDDLSGHGGIRHHLTHVSGWCAENRVQPGDGRVFGRNLKAAIPHLRDVRLNQAGERIWAYSGIGLRDDVVASLGTQWW
jgi:hypothetical protein